MKEMPLLLAVTKPMAGPKVPIWNKTNLIIVVSGLVIPDRIILYGSKGWGHSQEIATIKDNGSHRVHLDDFIGCEEVWAQKTGVSSIRVYAWVQ